MNILVCVKQVPDAEGLITLGAGEAAISFSGAYRMNRYDEYALEEALRIRERGDARMIDAVTVGPARAASTARRALEMGAMNGIHIVTKDTAALTPFETAALIASYAWAKDYDLILTGVMSEDGMHCQTGPMIAAMCRYPCASSVIAEEPDRNRNGFYVEREIEGGRRVCMTVALPAVLTIQSGINRPRYPALSNVLRARSQKLTEIGADVLTPPAPRERVVAYRYPDVAAKGISIEGSTEEKAAGLWQVLHERNLI